MKSICVCALTALLLAASAPSTAWHWDHERESKKFTSQAGDPRYLEDLGGCLEQIEGRDDVHCYALYGHLFDPSAEVRPLNIQRPSPDCSQQTDAGTLQPGIEPVAASARFVFDYSPGLVEYNGSDCDQPRIHPSRGPIANVRLDRDVDILGYWFLSADTLASEEFPLKIGVLPCLTLHMRLDTGTGRDRDTIAAGTTTKTVVTSPQGQGTTSAPQPVCPNGETPDKAIEIEQITEIEVNLGPAKRGIEPHEDLRIAVSWYLHDGGDPQQENNLSPYTWSQHSGSDHPNRIVFALREPLQVERVRPQLFDDKIYIHTVLKSAWGPYDIDTTNVRVEIKDEAGKTIADRRSPHMENPIMRYSSDPGNHLSPANLTFPWDFSKERLQPGHYTIHVSAANWQHTATTTGQASFTYHEDGKDCCVSHPPGPIDRVLEPDGPRTDPDTIPYLLSTLTVLVAIGVFAGAYRGRLRF